MSQSTKQEVLAKLRRAYARAGRFYKGQMLDQAVALLGYHRKAAIRALRAGPPAQAVILANVVLNAAAGGTDFGLHLQPRDGFSFGSGDDPFWPPDAQGVLARDEKGRRQWPKPGYHLMRMIQMMPGTRRQVRLTDLSPDVRVWASADGQSVAVLACNYHWDWPDLEKFSDKSQPRSVQVKVAGLGNATTAKVQRFLIDDEHSNLGKFYAQHPAAPPAHMNSDLAMVEDRRVNVTNGTLALPTVQLGRSATTLWLLSLVETPTKPVAHFGFEEADGALARDAAGRFTGRIEGPVVRGPGRVGRALYFDGVSNRVDLGNAPALHLEMPFTVSLWVKAEPVEHGAVLIADKQPNWASPGMLLQYQPGDGIVWFAAHDHRHIGTSPAPEKEPVKPENRVTLSDGRWHHVALRVASEQHALFIDGTNRARKVWMDAGPVVDAAKLKRQPGEVVPPYVRGSGKLFLGDSPLPWGEWKFKGWMDEVRFYDRALTDNEIQNLAREASGSDEAAGL